MRMRVMSLLKWTGLVELIIGAWNLSLGLMSVYALFVQSPQAIQQAVEEETGVFLPLSQIYGPVAITVIGGLLMTLAGVIGFVFCSRKGKEKLPVILGWVLLAYVAAADLILMLFLGGVLTVSNLFPFVLHGLYLWGAIKNKHEMTAVM